MADRARRNVWHELAHHIFARRVITDSALLRGWLDLQGGGYRLEEIRSQEDFADQFVRAMSGLEPEDVVDYFRRFLHADRDRANE